MSLCSIIARDARGYTSPVVVLTIVECPNCVQGECNFDTAQRHEDATSAYYQRASCACNTGYTGTACTFVGHCFLASDIRIIHQVDTTLINSHDAHKALCLEGHGHTPQCPRPR